MFINNRKKQFGEKSTIKEVDPEEPLEDHEEQAHLKAVASAFLNYEVFDWFLYG